MRYVAAYLLAVLGGNASPSESDIKKILSSVGIEADSTQLNKVISELKGKNLDDVIAEGMSDTCVIYSRRYWSDRHLCDVIAEGRSNAAPV